MEPALFPETTAGPPGPPAAVASVGYPDAEYDSGHDRVHEEMDSSSGYVSNCIFSKYQTAGDMSPILTSIPNGSIRYPELMQSVIETRPSRFIGVALG